MQPLTASRLEELEEYLSASEEALMGHPVVDALEARGLDLGTVLGNRLGVGADFPGYAKYQGMLVIPYLGKRGEPLSVRFRCMEDHDHRANYHGKYNSMPDEPARMFNVGAIFRAVDTIHVTEGELDALVLNKLGLPAVAMPGAQSFQWRHQKMLAGFNRVWVWGDGDEAGAEFSRKITRKMHRAKSVRMPTGMDVNELYLASGKDAVLALIEEDK